MDWGVNSGLRRGAKDSEGSERRYAETRANVSSKIVSVCNRLKLPAAVPQTYLPGPHPKHLDMCTPKRTDLQLAVIFLCGFAFRSIDRDLTYRRNRLLRTPSGFRVCLLQENGGLATTIELRTSVPNISRFFSGKRFPVAALSSIDDQMFFFGPSLLDCRLLFPVLDLFGF